MKLKLSFMVMSALFLLTSGAFAQTSGDICAKIHNQGAWLGASKFQNGKEYNNIQEFFFLNLSNDPVTFPIQFVNENGIKKSKAITIKNADWYRQVAKSVTLQKSTLNFKDAKCSSFNGEYQTRTSALANFFENVKDVFYSIIGILIVGVIAYFGLKHFFLTQFGSKAKKKSAVDNVVSMNKKSNRNSRGGKAVTVDEFTVIYFLNRQKNLRDLRNNDWMECSRKSGPPFELGLAP